MSQRFSNERGLVLMAARVRLPALPTLQQTLNTGVIVIIVLMLTHFFPQIKFWERFPAFGRRAA